MKTNSMASRDQVTAAYNLTDRYRLMTDAALRALRNDLFPNQDAARQALDQLVGEGILKEATLFENHRCFYATASCHEKQDFSEATKIRAYAMLAVCSARSSQRTKLTQQEFRQYFPDTYRPGLPTNYYVDLRTDQPKLGFLRVDLGGAARWDRIVAKAQSDVRKHRLEPAFSRFVKRNALEIRIVTALPQKADRLQRALSNMPAQPGIPIHVSVVPELLNLIAPLPA